MDYIYCFSFANLLPPLRPLKARKGDHPLRFRACDWEFIEYWAFFFPIENRKGKIINMTSPISFILSEIIYEMVLWWNNQIARAWKIYGRFISSLLDAVIFRFYFSSYSSLLDQHMWSIETVKANNTAMTHSSAGADHATFHKLLQINISPLDGVKGSCTC